MPCPVEAGAEEGAAAVGARLQRSGDQAQHDDQLREERRGRHVRVVIAQGRDLSTFAANFKPCVPEST